MATYKQISDWVKRRFGFVPKKGWIAHTKEMLGIPVRFARNRHDPNRRVVPCPYDRQIAIQAAFRYFKMN
jgi:hypothetical protein